MSPKRILSQSLMPLARISRLVGPGTRRLWAHAHLGAGLGKAVDPSIVIEGPIELHGTRQIELGRRLLLYPGQYWETQADGILRIGDDVVLSRGVHLVSFSRIDIGSGTMIGEYSSVRDANHRRHGTGTLRDRGHDASAIRIGRGVWIGRGVSILSGVSIGDRAVIGANAVVTRDVAADAVVGGIPASQLRSRQTETV
jgi:acetyltransferase-like isoleucine patch superfamily enzyme